MDVKLALDAISSLTAPDTPNEAKDKHQDDVFGVEVLLRSNMDKLQNELTLEKYALLEKILRTSKLNNCQHEADIRWNFVIWNLKLLSILKTCLEEAVNVYKHDLEKKNTSQTGSPPPMSPDTFSFSQQKSILTSVQFVIMFGMCPAFLPAVGVPVEKRSEFGTLIKASSECRITLAENMQRLLTCLKVLSDCIQLPSLGGIILSKHLGDILTGLVQIVYAPLKPAPAASNTDKVAGTAPKSQRRLLTETDKTWCQIQLQKLLQHSYQPLVVKQLLVLQGGPKSTTVNTDKKLKPAPRWLQRVCGQLLSERLMQHKGVQYVLLGMLDGTTDDQTGASPDWRKCDAIAQIISNCPINVKSVDSYYGIIAPQILDLLNNKDKLVARQFLRVAVSTVIAMLSKEPKITHKLLIQPVLLPLSICCSQHEQADHVIVPEENLAKTIETMHKIYVTGCNPHQELLLTLVPVSLVLFQLYMFTQEGLSHLRNLVEEILLQLLRHSDAKITFGLFLTFAFEKSDAMEISAMDSDKKFEIGSNGGIAVVKESKCCAEDVLDFSNRSSAFIMILDKMNNQQLSAQLFIHVLQKMTLLLTSNRSFHTPSSDASFFHDLEKYQDEQRSDIKEALLTLDMIARLIETFGETCLTQLKHIIQFVQVTLNRGLKLLKSSDTTFAGSFESETLSLAIGLLGTVLITGDELSIEDKASLKTLLPLLQELCEIHPEERIREMASDLRVAIATHGLVQSEAVKAATEYMKLKESRKCQDLEQDITLPTVNKPDVKPNIEIISENVESVNISTEVKAKYNEKEYSTFSENGSHYLGKSERISKTVSNDVPDKMNYKDALKEVEDVMIPVQGHGLIVLRKLIEQKDLLTMQNCDRLVPIFKRCILHEDTYVYLAAVQALAALANHRPDEILPLLIEEYAGFEVKNQKNRHSPESRIKVGEVIVKTTRELGDMAPKYRDKLLPVFLLGAKDTDCLVRASSLSNLGELCKLLRFSLGSIIHEIISCCGSIVKSDPEVQVRQAAAMLIMLLFQGLGTDSIKVLQSVIQDTYKLLKHVTATEREPGVLLHVHLALEELDKIMRELLFPKQILTKRIRVLDAE